MTEGWFAGIPAGDEEAAATAIREGAASEPADWPGEAVDSGFASDTDAYYERLQEATVTAARAAVREAELSDDQQLIHAVRAMDDCESTANELAERVTEWAGTHFEDAQAGIEGARSVADREPTTPLEERVVDLAGRVRELADETAQLRRYVEQTTPSVAPNLAALAGPVLAARLVALAGGLEDLAKQPSGTVQVLGAEDALFAHLQGGAPSPKHGVIYTHEYVRNTAPDNRGSAARALAGKLTIAARIDHYSGDLRPELEAELRDRIETIRARDTQ
ncbi:NOP5/NOP56 family protein [Salinibaculum rarum]|uniref:NOP5/NOP56 family protein n=1 Tax=Salinibaculum rarum TaxID=3058903 RepID=UPI00265F9A9C|nr:NOP5/NOP56 family protein [Salinibaculum sp. KK48]